MGMRVLTSSNVQVGFHRRHVITCVLTLARVSLHEVTPTCAPHLPPRPPLLSSLHYLHPIPSPLISPPYAPTPPLFPPCHITGQFIIIVTVALTLPSECTCTTPTFIGNFLPDVNLLSSPRARR